MGYNLTLNCFYIIVHYSVSKCILYTFRYSKITLLSFIINYTFNLVCDKRACSYAKLIIFLLLYIYVENSKFLQESSGYTIIYISSYKCDLLVPTQLKKGEYVSSYMNIRICASIIYKVKMQQTVFENFPETVVFGICFHLDQACFRKI